MGVDMMVASNVHQLLTLFFGQLSVKRGLCLPQILWTS